MNAHNTLTTDKKTDCSAFLGDFLFVRIDEASPFWEYLHLVHNHQPGFAEVGDDAEVFVAAWEQVKHVI